MKRFGLLLTALVLCAPAALFAQVEYSVSNFMRYGNGEQVIGGQLRHKEYIENQTNVRLFWDNFTVVFEYLYDDPPEFGPRFQGIRKRYVEFAKTGLELRAGDFYTLYGKGLAMNLSRTAASITTHVSTVCAAPIATGTSTRFLPSARCVTTTC